MTASGQDGPQPPRPGTLDDEPTCIAGGTVDQNRGRGHFRGYSSGAFSSISGIGKTRRPTFVLSESSSR